MLITRCILLSAYKLNLNICMCILIKVCKMAKFDLSEWKNNYDEIQSISKDLYKSLEKYSQINKKAYEEAKKANDKYNENGDYQSNVNYDALNIEIYYKYLYVFYWNKYLLKEYEKNQDIFDTVKIIKLGKIDIFNRILYDIIGDEDLKEINKDEKASTLLSFYKHTDSDQSVPTLGIIVENIYNIDLTVKGIFMDLSIVSDYDSKLIFNSTDNKDPFHIDVFYGYQFNSSLRADMAKVIVSSVYNRITYKENNDYLIEAMTSLEKILGLSKTGDEKELVSKILKNLSKK